MPDIAPDTVKDIATVLKRSLERLNYLAEAVYNPNNILLSPTSLAHECDRAARDLLGLKDTLHQYMLPPAPAPSTPPVVVTEVLAARDQARAEQASSDIPVSDLQTGHGAPKFPPGSQVEIAGTVWQEKPVVAHIVLPVHGAPFVTTSVRWNTELNAYVYGVSRPDDYPKTYLGQDCRNHETPHPDCHWLPEHWLTPRKTTPWVNPDA